MRTEQKNTDSEPLPAAEPGGAQGAPDHVQAQFVFQRIAHIHAHAALQKLPLRPSGFQIPEQITVHLREV